MITNLTVHGPYCLQELKEVGGTEELEKEIKKRIKRKGTSEDVLQ